VSAVAQTDSLLCVYNSDRLQLLVESMSERRHLCRNDGERRTCWNHVLMRWRVYWTSLWHGHVQCVLSGRLKMQDWN